MLAAVAVPAQDGFVSYGGPVPAPIGLVRDSPTSAFVLRDGILHRVRGDESHALASTAPLGPGRGYALARHPQDGRVFLAAERGLFVLDAEHDVLDAPSTRDGFPEGSPRGVHVDAEGRVWLLTDRAFGVLDPRYFQGRTFDRRDGLPAPPFRALGATDDGRLVLVTESGAAFAYRPDRGPAPSARLLGDAADGRLIGASDGTAVVDVEAEARGGATLRFRRVNHHLLYPLEAGLIHGLKPGSHGVELVVEDRDLRARSLGTIVVDVPYPEAFDTSFLPYAALGGFALLQLAFLLVAARRGRLRNRWRHAMLSAGLSFWIALMLLAGVLRYGKAWPLIGFSMYTETYEEGSVLYQPRLRTLHSDGTRQDLTFQQAGLIQDGYWQVVSEIVHGKRGRWRSFTRRLDRRRQPGSARVVGFEIIDHRVRLTSDGPVDVAPNVLLHHREP